MDPILEREILAAATTVIESAAPPATKVAQIAELGYVVQSHQRSTARLRRIVDSLHSAAFDHGRELR